MKCKVFTAGSESALQSLIDQWLRFGRTIEIVHVTSAANAINFMILIFYNE
jgi:hypothetical protein